MKLIESFEIHNLQGKAKINQRKRLHLNIHDSYSDKSQRLFNSICLESYIQPHRHKDSGTEETLLCLQGEIGIVQFNNCGEVILSRKLVPMKDAMPEKQDAVCVSWSSDDWHTVISLTSQSLILEIKAGPFNPEEAKQVADWAPSPSSFLEAQEYLLDLRSLFL